MKNCVIKQEIASF